MSMQFVTPDRAPRPSALPPAAPGAGLSLDGASLAYDRNAEIFCEGEAAEFVYQVASGVVRTYRLLGDGRRQIEAFYFAGDCFGLEAGLDRRTSADALTATVLTRVKRATLTERASRDLDMARELWSLTARHLRQAQDHAMMLGRRSATERVVGFLLDMAERGEAQADAVELPMSRLDIADYLGLTIETVSRTLTQLQGSGYLAVPSNRRIVLRDRLGLAELCD